MGGIIAGIKKINTRSGTTMAFITVEDMYGSVECLAFPKVYERIKGVLKVDRVVRLSGKIDVPAEKAPSILLDRMEEVETESPKQQTPATEVNTPAGNSEQTLWLDARNLSEEDFEELMETLQSYEGNVPAKVLHGGKRFEYGVRLNRALSAEIMTFLSDDKIKLL